MKNQGILLSCLLFLLLAFPINCFGQKEVQITDSLEQKLREAKFDTTRVSLLISLSRSLYLQESIKARFYASKALDLSQKLGFKKGIAESYGMLGATSWVNGNYQEAL
ncbi:MAG: hypothetical protein HC880_09005 [Bacteroidia bacterium]|nr:hypothetical protein [Bacteroidia bacterium]